MPKLLRLLLLLQISNPSQRFNYTAEYVGYSLTGFPPSHVLPGCRRPLRHFLPQTSADLPQAPALMSSSEEFCSHTSLGQASLGRPHPGQLYMNEPVGDELPGFLSNNIKQGSRVSDQFMTFRPVWNLRIFSHSACLLWLLYYSRKEDGRARLRVK